MRRLLLKLDYWWYERSPARIRGLVRDVERSFDEIRGLQSKVAALEAVVDRFVSPRLASKEILRLLSHLPEEKALALVKETAERMKTEGEL